MRLANYHRILQLVNSIDWVRRSQNSGMLSSSVSKIFLKLPGADVLLPAK
jgi:hypothetical protein